MYLIFSLEIIELAYFKKQKQNKTQDSNNKTTMDFLAASVRRLGVDILPCKHWFLNKDTCKWKLTGKEAGTLLLLININERTVTK